jgi:hypothetical protein
MEKIVSYNVRPEALIDVFELYKGKKFISLQTKTAPDLTKKGRVSKLTFVEKFGADPKELFKYSEFSAGIGYDYATLIEHRQDKDDVPHEDYQAGTSWHIPYNNSTVIRQHKTKPDQLYFYVSLIANNPAKSEYRIGDRVIDKDALAEFLDVPRKPTNQGLASDRSIEVRTLKLDSVTRVRADGWEWIVVKNENKPLTY